MRLLTYKDASIILNCSTSKVQKMVAAGQLPFVKIGALTRIPDEALQEHLRRSVRRNCVDDTSSSPLTAAERWVVSG